MAAENDFESVARQWQQQWAVGKSERHARIVLTRLGQDVFPDLGNRAISDIQAYELVATIKKNAGRGPFISLQLASEYLEKMLTDSHPVS